jgi:protein gp37
VNVNKTKIEWVKNPDGSQGYTWNPITGCLNHVNGLCKGGGFPCYAYKLANGRLKERYLANQFVPPDHFKTISHETNVVRGWALVDPFYPRFWAEKLEQLKPPHGDYYYHDYKGIFVCDMSDLFGIGIPEDWTKKVIDKIKTCPQYRFYLLTKQPQNLIKWSPFPENCFVGVTATDTYMAVKGLQCLDKIEAKVKFISFEPLLSQTCMTASSLSGINWLIIGQCTPVKAKTEPKIEWIKEIVEAADRAGVKVFLKDNLESLLGQDKNYKKFRGYDSEGNMLVSLRQEMPSLVATTKEG